MRMKRTTSVIASHVAPLSLACLVLAGQVRAEETLQPSQGRYVGHAWRIDENHLIWWDDKPYVRYGFTGNGDVDRFIQLGFNQFNIGPSEQLWAASDDPAKRRQAVQQVDEFTGRLVARGATYYANLNILWPTSDKIAPADRVVCVVKRVWTVTPPADGSPLEVSFAGEGRWPVDKARSRVYLFDMTEGRSSDISSKLKEIRITREVGRESAAERGAANRYTLVLEPPDLPPSHDLRITFVGTFDREYVPGVYPSALPALWKPGVQSYFRESLRSLRAAYAKEGLRGMSFGDEIDTYKTSLLGSVLYVDFNNDAVALGAYRDWLKERFKTVAEFNASLGTKSRSFDEVTWRLCIYPFIERDGRREQERPQTFGLFDSFEQLERLDNLQEQFRVWFYGHWLAEYGRMAKEIVGNVPVFVTSAGMEGPAKDYLQIHKCAMLDGLDGLSRNHYAWVGRTGDGRPATFIPGSQRRFPLETVTEMLDSVQSQSGRTKAYWANEFGRPQRGEGGFVDDFGLGHQFSFPSKDDLRDFLSVLIANGYKGFNMFKMNPTVEAAQQEVQWMAELREEMIRKTIDTTIYEKPVTITQEQAVAAARNHPSLKAALDRHPDAQTSASFHEGYSVWIVTFTDRGKEIGFASVSPDGRILESQARD